MQVIIDKNRFNELEEKEKALYNKSLCVSVTRTGNRYLFNENIRLYNGDNANMYLLSKIKDLEEEVKALEKKLNKPWYRF